MTRHHSQNPVSDLLQDILSDEKIVGLDALSGNEGAGVGFMSAGRSKGRASSARPMWTPDAKTARRRLATHNLSCSCHAPHAQVGETVTGQGFGFASSGGD